MGTKAAMENLWKISKFIREQQSFIEYLHGLTNEVCGSILLMEEKWSSTWSVFSHYGGKLMTFLHFWYSFLISYSRNLFRIVLFSNQIIVLFQVFVKALGYDNLKVVKLNGKDIPSLVSMLDRRKDADQVRARTSLALKNMTGKNNFVFWRTILD